MCAKIAIEKMSGAIVRSRKGRMDMATMTRFYGLYEKSYESRFEEDFGRGLVLMRSYKTEHLRENVA